MRAGIFHLKSRIIIGVALLCAQLPLQAFSGRVVGVSDGDTITVLQSDSQGHQTPTKVRLAGIDCPEKAQAFGYKAKQFTSDLVFQKYVRVEVTDQDRYGRTVGEVLIGTTSLNQSLVANGYAWWYRRYAPKNETLKTLETQAKNKKLGLWIDHSPVPPWEFRRGRRIK